MLTYQDFQKAPNRAQFIARLIRAHMGGPEWKTARDAELYERGLNVTINRVTSLYNGRAYSYDGADNRVASNFFHRLNTDRCAYSLGNGLSFTRKEKRVDETTGAVVTVDLTREALGPDFDTACYVWAYHALEQGVAFGFWNLDHLDVYPLTQFAPMYDENNGALMAGARFWRLDEKRPWNVELYTPEGFSRYQSRPNTTGWDLVLIEEERPYVGVYLQANDGSMTLVSGETYSALPVVPLWGNRLKQSSLINMRAKIDAYDLINSAFANDEQDCATIYWLLQNQGGMDRKACKEFLDRIRTDHIAQIDVTGFDGDARGAMTPYTQETPYQSRKAYLEHCRADIYEGFGALDVHTIAAGATNDHIDAAYQSVDNEADDFEYQVILAVRQVLRLKGIDDTPTFKRNRISNVKEQIEAVMLEAPHLDDETILDLLPNISVDMKEGILARRYANNLKRLTKLPAVEDEEDEDDGDGEGES